MNRGAAGGIAEVPARGHAQGRLNEEYCHKVRQRLSEMVRAERGGEGPPDVGNRGEEAVAGARATGDAQRSRGPSDSAGGSKRARAGEHRLITEWARRIEQVGKGDATESAGAAKGEQAKPAKRSEQIAPPRWRDEPNTQHGSREPLTVLRWNAQGLRKKLVEVGDVTQRRTLGWGGSPGGACMEGYTQYFSSLPRARTRTKKPLVLQPQHQHARAGVLTLISNGLRPKHTVTRLQEPDHLRGYALALKALTERGHIMLLNVYLPPGDDYRQAIMSGTTEWIREVWPGGNAPVLVGGDFNGGWFCADRPSGGPTARDTHYRRWADELGVGPTDLWVRNRYRELSFNPQAVSGSRASGDSGRSRVDDILLSRGEVGLSGSAVLGASRVARGLAHTSDHDPIL
eukprot:1181762-Prorocentrum_minimum.AAC.1